MRYLRAWGAMAIGLVACIGDNTQSSPDAGNDGGGGDGPTADAPPSQPPTHAPSSVTLRDGDVTQGTVNGMITVGKASDESDVASYVLYWGANATTKLNGQNAIATVAKTGGNLDVPINTPVPLGATKILAFTANAVGEMTTGPATDADNYTRFADVSAGTSGYGVSAAIDSAGGKLLVATCAQGSTALPSLVRCNLDGTGCSASDISGGNHTWGPVHAAVDAASAKIVVTGTNDTSGPQIFRCNLDGTSCTYQDLSSLGAGVTPSPVIDAANGKLLVIAQLFSTGQLAYYRCNLDGTSCSFTNLSTQAGKGNQTGQHPAPVIDTVNNKLLIAVGDNTVTPEQMSLFVCNLDGTGCVAKDISVGQGQNSGLNPSIAVDPTGHFTAVGDGPHGFRCALDGTGCTYHDLSVSHYGARTSVAVDAASSKLYVAAQDSSTKLALYRCELDGSACAYVDMSAGHPNASGGTPSIVIDTTNQRILVATIDGSNGGKPALFTLGLW